MDPAAPARLSGRLIAVIAVLLACYSKRSSPHAGTGDVTTLNTLLLVLVGQTATMSLLLPAVVVELGALELVEFGGHLAMLALYTALHSVAEELEGTSGDAAADGVGGAKAKFRRVCRRDAWQYGSWLD